MILSILICSLESRKSQLDELMFGLQKQVFDKEIVETIVIVDNKQMTTGEKRNKLLDLAKGKYIVFIDDDDSVPEYYIEEMLKACAFDVDCIAINGTITTNGKDEIKWRLSKNNENITVVENGKSVYLRKTNHITSVKKEHALKARFPHKSNAEDKGYSDSINKYLHTEFVIEKPMYHYRFSTFNKEYK